MLSPLSYLHYEFTLANSIIKGSTAGEKPLGEQILAQGYTQSTCSVTNTSPHHFQAAKLNETYEANTQHKASSLPRRKPVHSIQYFKGITIFLSPSNIRLHPVRNASLQRQRK